MTDSANLSEQQQHQSHIQTQAQLQQTQSQDRKQVQAPNSQPQPSSHSQSIADEQQKKEALAAFTATLHSVGANLEAPLRDRAATLQSNDAALERQEAELWGHAQKLAKQNAQWEGIAEEARRGLKEIGDVQNWAEMIERDLLALEDMMENVERKGREEEEMRTADVREGDGGRGVELDREGVANGKKKDNAAKGWLRWW